MGYGQQNIRVNVLSPGILNTRLFRDRLTTVDERAEVAETVAGLKRIGTPVEMAEATLFLASENCRYLTGSSLLAD